MKVQVVVSIHAYGEDWEQWWNDNLEPKIEDDPSEHCVDT